MRIVFAIVPAHGDRKRADPVLILLGGPGQAASRMYGALAAEHRGINRSRDVILVDQRGTGRSSPLGCVYGSDDDLQSYMDFLPIDAVRACAATLPSIDVSRYGTRDFVADLEALRAALGVVRWNLHGGSYGTRVALDYMARHPGSIRSAILMGVAPRSQVLPVPFATDADRAIRMLIEDCAAEPSCGRAFPRLAQEIDSIARRLERAPVEVFVRNPASGEPSRVQFSRAAFGEIVRSSLYTAGGARVLPISVHEAYLADYTALATSHLRRQRGIARDGSTGLYLAVTCPEDVARADQAATIAASRKTTLGEYRARQHFAACASWPRAKRADEPAGRHLATPVLMLVGDRDPVTPPAWARDAQSTMGSARLVVVPHGGHGFGGMIGVGCLERLQVAFLEAPVPSRLDAGCVTAIRPPPFLVAR